jgi:hypothetical protein
MYQEINSVDKCITQELTPPLVVDPESTQSDFSKANSSSCGFRLFPGTDDREPLSDCIWNHALFMAGHGFRVFPLKKRDKTPLFNGWREKATSDAGMVLDWTRRYPDSNYGVVTGHGFFVIDFDLDESDDINEEIRKVQKKLGSFEPGTVVKTGRGYQLYCSSGEFDIRNNHEKRLTDKVDIKGNGGYVVGVGSTHPNGERYEFCDARTLSNGIQLTRLPDAALHYIVSLQGSRTASTSSADVSLRPVNSSGSRVLTNALDCEIPIPEGKRNDTLFKIGCHYREMYGLGAADIRVILLEKNRQCEIPLTESEISVIAESCGKYPAGNPRYAQPEVASSTDCTAEVFALFKDNAFVKLVRKNVQKFHVGDWNIAELLVLSVASQSVINTDGIQPKLSGESGKGKTHVSRSVLHLLHPSMYRAASFSSKVLFYDDTLTPKTVIFSDDVSLNDDVEEIVRAAMSNWYEPTQRMTLDAKRNPVTLSLPPRISFWFTSVKTTSTLQLINRQVEVNVDESPDQDKRVEEHQRRLSALGMPEFYVDEEVELLREAFLHLNQIDFKVKIPFVDRIKFNDVSNRRNFPIFLDFIKAYCLLNYEARLVDDDQALIATREDFDNALSLFATVAVQQITKLNEKERQVAAAIKDRSPCDINEIREITGLGFSSIYELIHGDRKAGNKGLLEKIHELRLYPKNEFNEETGERWGRNHYSLPANWKIVDNSASIVCWNDNEEDQFRAVSEHFGDEFRNSEKGLEGSDSRLGGLTVILYITLTLISVLRKKIRHPSLDPLPPHSTEVPKQNQMIIGKGRRLPQNLKQMPKTPFILFQKHDPKLTGAPPKLITLELLPTPPMNLKTYRRSLNSSTTVLLM